jgi:glutathione S-transferase
MTDLFEKMASQAGMADTSKYGLSGDLKKTQYILELLGTPIDANTLKCLLTAGEQGMEMNSYNTDKMAAEEFQAEFQKISPFGITPCLKEADFMVCGTKAILAFIDARGLGYSLSPLNAALVAMQNYWSDIAIKQFAPVAEYLINKEVNGTTGNDAEQLSRLDLYLSALDNQLRNNKYIVCDKYTWADLHWTAYIHLIVVAGHVDLINKHQNVAAWWQKIKTKKSQCGQDLVAYELLPNLDDIKTGRLQSVEIQDY